MTVLSTASTSEFRQIGVAQAMTLLSTVSTSGGLEREKKSQAMTVLSTVSTFGGLDRKKSYKL